MATVKAFIRIGKDTKKNKNKNVNIRFRLSDGRTGIDKKTGEQLYGIQLFHSSELIINFDKWDKKRHEMTGRGIHLQDCTDFNNAINDRKKIILDIYIRNLAQKQNLTSDWLNAEIDKVLYPEKYETPKQTFFAVFDNFLEKRKMSNDRKKHFKVVYRSLQRYQLYTQKRKKNFELILENITPDTLQSIAEFIGKENEIYMEYPDIYKKISEYHKLKQRSQNTINDMLRMLRTFFIWAEDNGIIAINPFRKYTIDECVYGTPYYISIEERNKLFDTDFYNRPALETQRDIFIFQCLIGCRVADLYRFTKANVINGEIQYIARKTKDGRPVNVEVPLTPTAKKILAKYSNHDGKLLLPYISDQKYNKAIKEMFKIAGLIRPVVTLDPLTRESVIRPLNEIASSHLARRCFIGNLYKQIKDPNLVGVLSGHKEGSRAFSRYREIDKDIKVETVMMLE